MIFKCEHCGKLEGIMYADFTNYTLTCEDCKEKEKLV